MSWSNPEMLWWLMLVPICFALFLTEGVWRMRALKRFGTSALNGSILRGAHGTTLRILQATLFTSTSFLLVLSLAGPQYGSRTQLLRKEGIDIVIALDFSKSMLATDVRPSRIDRAKAEIAKFISELGGDRVGIVTFAGETMEFPMTVDYASLALYLRSIGPSDMPVGGTAIGRALIASQRLLARATTRDSAGQNGDTDSKRAQIVVLFTDGEDHEGDPIKAARELSASGIRLYTVGIGSRTGETIPTYDPSGNFTGWLRDSNGEQVLTALTSENEAALQEMAELTGGRYFRARRGGVGIDSVRQE
ncbi:MAG: VWA domain-containing protein, partial [Myxococcota bacterium]